ncbi:MAG: hypothetical protein E7071_01550 [Bacteroidales bacterium]|nr:hypothetical protein [Bacteroidales bacterium]
MKSRLLILSLFIFTTLQVKAQVVEHIYTKDGAIYEGYISEQIPGRQIMISAERARLVFPKSSVSGLKVESKGFDKLSEEAKEWFTNIGNTTDINKASFTANGVFYDDAYMLKNDADSITIVSFGNRTYPLIWGAIAKTIKTNTNEMVHGVGEIITTVLGQHFIGQIVEQYLGKYITLQDEKGDMRRIDYSNILHINAQKLSERYTLWEQVQLLDRLVLVDGSVVEGFINQRVIGSKVFITEVGQNTDRPIVLKDIKKYQKVPNKLYQPYGTNKSAEVSQVEPKVTIVPETVVEPKVKKTISDGQRIFVNDIEVKPISSFQDSKRIYFPGSSSAVVTTNDKVVIELVGIKPDSEMYVYTTKDMMPDVAMDDPHAMKMLPSIKWSDSPIWSSEYVMRGNKRSAEFIPENAGTYFISLKQDMSLGVLVVVKSDEL